MESNDKLSTLSAILDELVHSENEIAEVASRIAVRFLQQRMKPDGGRANWDIQNPASCPVCGRLTV